LLKESFHALWCYNIEHLPRVRFCCLETKWLWGPPVDNDKKHCEDDASNNTQIHRGLASTKHVVNNTGLPQGSMGHDLQDCLTAMWGNTPSRSNHFPNLSSRHWLNQATRLHSVKYQTRRPIISLEILGKQTNLCSKCVALSQTSRFYHNDYVIPSQLYESAQNSHQTGKTFPLLYITSSDQVSNSGLYLETKGEATSSSIAYWLAQVHIQLPQLVYATHKKTKPFHHMQEINAYKHQCKGMCPVLLQIHLSMWKLSIGNPKIH
jgi:hypothetical protein